MSKSLRNSEGLVVAIDEAGCFRALNPERVRGLYFPLVNEAGLLSAVTPELKGDIKIDQHSFLLAPVSREDLHLNAASRNFWVRIERGEGKPKSSGVLWSVSGQSVWQKANAMGPEESVVEAGLLWHKLTRTNAKLGIEAQVMSFIPWDEGPVEVMAVQIKNLSKKTVRVTGTSAIPLYGRSADNLRDHRHVTSLLNRVSAEKFGLSLRPTMSFNERGHLVNQAKYFVLGLTGAGRPPVGFFPTVDSFIGDDGDLLKPSSLINNLSPAKDVEAVHQGREALGGLQFSPMVLKPGGAARFILLLGIDKNGQEDLAALAGRFNSWEKAEAKLQATKGAWAERSSRLSFKTGDNEFNSWTKWVCVQPVLRKIFGCSFLPDFDYGRGGRGWRDLWQDCLALILLNPADVRRDIVENYGGVRIDGSNATIIARKWVAEGEGGRWTPEFIADRNKIVRTWMDHGVWPFLTTKLYIDQSGDWDVLMEKIPYFRDGQLKRGRLFDADWNEPVCRLRNKSGEVHTGTVLEHILVQHLVQFFNVGGRNNIRLEDADWNDGLDMAHQKGESVAFTAFYAGQLEVIAELAEKLAQKKSLTDVTVPEELMLLIDSVSRPVNYDSPVEKNDRLNGYFDATLNGLSGKQTCLSVAALAGDLRAKADWIKKHLRRNEWIEARGHSWFNGYYDNASRRVEGLHPDGRVRMTLTGQVFQIMFGVASEEQIRKITRAVDQFLFDPALGGVRLNSNFGAVQPDLGRAFSFSFGEKENGAVFSHMAVMYASALYRRGFTAEGFKVLNSLYAMARNSKRSKIYPGLPEYFNNEGRGLYHYLTGSASWYVLALLTQVFGVRGEGGDLMLSPQLMPEQFDRRGDASVRAPFADSQLTVIYHNPKKLAPGRYEIKDVRCAPVPVSFTRVSPREILIRREALRQRKSWEIEVFLG